MDSEITTEVAAADRRRYPARWLQRWEPAGTPLSELRAIWVAENVALDRGRAMSDAEVDEVRAAWHQHQARVDAGVIRG